MSGNRYIYIECSFNGRNSKKYTYKTTDTTIRPGDHAVVEAMGERKTVDVVSILPDFDESTVKFQIKEIIGKQEKTPEEEDV